MGARARVAWAAAAGAAAGGLIGYLYLTEHGRLVRAALDPWLDNIAREMRRLQVTAEKARTAADDGWRAVNGLRRGTRREAAWPPGGFSRSAG